MIALGIGAPSPASESDAPALELEGIVVTPHAPPTSLKYTRAPKGDRAARVDLILRNRTSEPVQITDARFNGKAAEELRSGGIWAWHNLRPGPGDTLPRGARVVWSYNARDERWGPGSTLTLSVDTDHGPVRHETPIDAPTAWLSALTFLGPESSVYPNQLVCHLANAGAEDLTIRGIALFVPSARPAWRVFDREIPLTGRTSFPGDGKLAARDRAIVVANSDPLPLGYALARVEVAAAGQAPRAIWGRTRLKRESFDISGGWVNGNTAVGPALAYEPFLKTLKRMHLNTAHIAETPGYTDDPERYGRYPLKYFHGLVPLDHYDRDEILPRVHAVEFLGEPQYPNPENLDSPQKVFDALLPYASSRFATTVTLSDESTWHYYAGLSDFPHYDSYRVVAPHVDAWTRYDRWGGKKILWGAPLETIGEMCRSLREQSRPAPTAYWSQGPADGWRGMDGRKRRSPTPDELRLQAYHALANRVTSLYWFNLSPKSLVKFRDTLDELTRVGREIRMLEDFYLAGDGYSYSRQSDSGGLGWDLATISAPAGALLFALDLDYAIDPDQQVFAFPPARPARFEFPLPPHLRGRATIFRVDADGTRDVGFELTERSTLVKDEAAKVAIYVAAADPALRRAVDERRARLVAAEEALGFDPARNDADFDQLERMIKR